MLLYSGLSLNTNYTMRLANIYILGDTVSEAAKDFHTKSNVPHPMVDIYGAFEFLIIVFEWVV